MPIKNRFIEVGTKALDFTLPSVSGDDVSLSQYAGNKNVVIVFSRGFL